MTETLPDYLSGKLTPTPQPEEGVTYAPMIKKEEGRLDFSQEAEALERRVRAFNPWPGAFMDFDGTLLKIHRARVEVGPAAAGQRLVVQDQPAVGAGGGTPDPGRCAAGREKADERKVFSRGCTPVGQPFVRGIG